METLVLHHHGGLTWRIHDQLVKNLLITP